jgi:hypothetical protein
MIFSNDQTDAVLNTLGEEQAAAWAQFYAQRATPKITLDQRAYVPSRTPELQAHAPCLGINEIKPRYRTPQTNTALKSTPIGWSSPSRSA